MASTGARANGKFLPRDPRVEEPFRLTPQLALRIAILGALAIAAFGVLFFRLWALQVLSGPQYLNAALNNQLRRFPIEAPRGPIVDRNGRTIVANQAGTALQLVPTDLAKTWRAQRQELQRLSAIVHVPVSEMLAKINRRGTDRLSPVPVKESLSKAEVDYLYERQRQFRGIRIAQTYPRRYLYGSLAAQVLGYVGGITPGELRRLHSKGYGLTDKIGQGGVEAAYDGYLRGRDGLEQRRVNALGQVRGGARLIERQPVGGESLRLTLDLKLQRAAEQGIQDGIAAAHVSNCVGCWAADGGAVVALDPNDGSVLAMASAPSYFPSVFSGRATKKQLAPLLNPNVAREDNYPALNRAIAGVYPSGSTFKPVTALAALQERVISPFETLPCTGQITIAKQVFKNWDPFASSAMDVATAIGASCDTFFYQLGYDFYRLPPERGHPLQAWATRFGLGRRSGIDLSGELPGLLPTPEWRQATYTSKTDPCCWRIDRLWKPGDSVQLAIGQKDLQVTPLQMARFYAVIANGGRLVKPHLGADVEQPSDGSGPGRILHSFAPPPSPRIHLDPTALAVVRDGLYQGTHASYGTSTAVFGSFPVPIAGKTGTAEKHVDLPTFSGLMDQSWWCGYGPADNPKIVVCALIENGGHGGTAAAPAALRVFEQYFHVKPAQTSTPRGD